MKRQIILDTAARLFAKRGLANTSTSLLAREAHVAEGTIFRYFKSKDDIFLELLIAIKNKLVVDVKQYLEVRNPETGLELIISLIKASYVFAKKNDTEFNLLFCDAPSRYGDASGEVRRHCLEIFQHLQEQFQIGIERGQVDGTINKTLPPEDTAAMLAASMTGIIRAIHLDLLNPTNEMPRFLEEHLSILLRP